MIKNALKTPIFTSTKIKKVSIYACLRQGVKFFDSLIPCKQKCSVYARFTNVSQFENTNFYQNLGKNALKCSKIKGFRKARPAIIKTQNVISGWRFVLNHILNKSKYFSKSLTKYVDSVFAIIYTDGELKQV